MAKIPTTQASILPTTSTGQVMKTPSLLELNRRPALKTTQISGSDLYDPRGDQAMAGAMQNVGKLVGNIAKDVQQRKNNLELTKSQMEVDRFFNQMKVDATKNPNTNMMEFGEKQSSDFRSRLAKSTSRVNRDKLLAYYDEKNERQRIWNIGHQATAIGEESEVLYRQSNKDLVYDISNSIDGIKADQLVTNIEEGLDRSRKHVLNMELDKNKTAMKLRDAQAAVGYGLLSMLNAKPSNAQSVKDILTDPEYEAWAKANLTGEDMGRLRTKIASIEKSVETKSKASYNKQLEEAVGRWAKTGNIAEIGGNVVGITEAIQKNDTYTDEQKTRLYNQIVDGIDSYVYDELENTGKWKEEREALRATAKEKYEFMKSTGIDRMVNWETKFDAEFDRRDDALRVKIMNDPMDYLSNDPDYRTLPSTREKLEYAKTFYAAEFDGAHMPKVISNNKAKTQIEELKNSPLFTYTQIDRTNKDEVVKAVNGVSAKLFDLYNEYGDNFFTLAAQMEGVSSEYANGEITGMYFAMKSIKERLMDKQLPPEQEMSEIRSNLMRLSNFKARPQWKADYETIKKRVTKDSDIKKYLQRSFGNAIMPVGFDNHVDGVVWASIMEFEEPRSDELNSSVYGVEISGNLNRHIVSRAGMRDLDNDQIKTGLERSFKRFKGKYGTVGDVIELTQMAKDSLSVKGSDVTDESLQKEYDRLLKSVIMIDDNTEAEPNVFMAIEMESGMIRALTQKDGSEISYNVKSESKRQVGKSKRDGVSPFSAVANEFMGMSF